MAQELTSQQLYHTQPILQYSLVLKVNYLKHSKGDRTTYCQDDDTMHLTD